MTAVLRLGVNDVPYSDAQPATKRRGKKPAAPGLMTTGDVADILEAKYHVMEIFFEQTKTDIENALVESLAGSMETILQSGGNGPPPFAEAEAAIKLRFDQFISQGEMEALGYPGVPTKAAIAGVSHRRAHPYAKSNPRRVSFFDTGLYLANFAAEVEG